MNYKLIVLLSCLLLCSCKQIRSLNISYDIEQKKSSLTPLLVGETDFNANDAFVLIGSVGQSEIVNDSSLKETASFLASGKYSHNGKELFLIVRHDLFLYEILPSENLPSSFSYLDGNDFQELQFAEFDQYKPVKCSDKQYSGGAMQCEAILVFDNLVSVLIMTFPVETEIEDIKDVMKPVIENVRYKIENNYHQ